MCTPNHGQTVKNGVQTFARIMQFIHFFASFGVKKILVVTST